jgi:hypothetical protein
MSTFDLTTLTDQELVQWATRFGGWTYFHCNDQLRDSWGGLSSTNNWHSIGIARRNEIIKSMGDKIPMKQLFEVGALRPIWITVGEDDGIVFEGHQGHWADCFFSNSYESGVRAALDEGVLFDGVEKYSIRPMTAAEIAVYPEIIEFRKSLMEQYGEV